MINMPRKELKTIKKKWWWWNLPLMISDQVFTWILKKSFTLFFYGDATKSREPRFTVVNMIFSNAKFKYERLMRLPLA